jgi:regulator of protease activity HflC (stomatin/prohibitin superfamily)
MSRQARAEQERQARVIRGQAEAEISDTFVQAAAAYTENPTALHLRAMNTLYEAIQERGSLVIVPSSAVESMGARSNPGNRVARRSKTLTIQAK